MKNPNEATVLATILKILELTTPHFESHIGMEVADVFIVLWIGGGFRRRDGFCWGCNSLLLLLSLLPEFSTFFRSLFYGYPSDSEESD